MTPVQRRTLSAAMVDLSFCEVFFSHSGHSTHTMHLSCCTLAQIIRSSRVFPWKWPHIFSGRNFDSYTFEPRNHSFTFLEVSFSNHLVLTRKAVKKSISEAQKHACDHSQEIYIKITSNSKACNVAEILRLLGWVIGLDVLTTCFLKLPFLMPRKLA